MNCSPKKTAPKKEAASLMELLCGDAHEINKNLSHEQIKKMYQFSHLDKKGVESVSKIFKKMHAEVSSKCRKKYEEVFVDSARATVIAKKVKENLDSKDYHSCQEYGKKANELIDKVTALQHKILKGTESDKKAAAKDSESYVKQMNELKTSEQAQSCDRFQKKYDSYFESQEEKEFLKALTQITTEVNQKHASDFVKYMKMKI